MAPVSLPPVEDPAVVADLVRRLSSGQVIRLRCIGGCMLPLVPPGTLFEVKRMDRPPHLGDLVLVGSPSVRLHRVVRVSGDSVVTRGDSARAEDPPVAARDVLARAVAVSTRIGFVPIDVALLRPFNVLAALLSPLRPRLADATRPMRESLSQSAPARLARRASLHARGGIRLGELTTDAGEAYLLFRSRIGLSVENHALALVREDLASGGFVTVAWLGRRIVGGVVARRVDRTFIYYDLGVDRRVRGAGVGRLLLLGLRDRARHLHGKRLMAEIREDNRPSLRLAEDLGLARVANDCGTVTVAGPI